MTLVGDGDREHFQRVEPAGRTCHPYSRRDEQLRDLSLPQPQTNPKHHLAQDQELELGYAVLCLCEKMSLEIGE